MANEKHLARLKQTVVNILAKAHQAVASGATYDCAWPKTWIVGLVLLLFFLWKLPQWYAASWDKLTDPKDIVKLVSDTRTTMVQAVGGIALLAGLLFTWRNLRMTEQNSRQTLDLSHKGQINDRFIKAIEQLGAVDQGGRKKLEVRLGGIYALEQIAKDSPDDHHWPIMEILTAYVRENASWKEGEQPSQQDIVPSETPPTQSNQSPPKLAPDIQAILTVLGRRTRTYRKGEGQRLNLANTDLQGADLGEAQLQGAYLGGAQLQGAYLGEAQLQGAYLGEAQLQGAVLGMAQLQGADLRGARLEGAMYVTVTQLSTVKTLYQAQLDRPLREQIQQRHPQLLGKPRE